MNSDNPFPAPAPDFSDPLGLLRACHERVLAHSRMLEELGRRRQADGSDDELQRGAMQIHRYFSEAGPHHHQDEEEGLFPHLTRMSPELAGVVQRLGQEHERINALWDKIAPQLLDLEAIEKPADFAADAGEFARLQREHVALENERLLDVAQPLFSSDELKQLGRSMAARRGVQLPGTF